MCDQREQNTDLLEKSRDLQEQNRDLKELVDRMEKEINVRMWDCSVWFTAWSQLAVLQYEVE